jgi:multidrug resistance efflux pump
MMMQQQLQQAGQAVQQLQGKLKEKTDGHLVKLTATRETNQAKFAIAQMQEGEKNKRDLATHIRALSESRSQLAQEAVRNLKAELPQAKVNA